MKLTFWGAAKTVTGSMHLVEAAGHRVALDCGLYQGRRHEAEERNRNFPVYPDQIHSVVLSHAHIDHSGNLPTLVKRGYRGPIYATAATADLCDPMLKDCGFLQEKDAEFINKRRSRRRAIGAENGDGAVKPLYTMDDAAKVLSHFRHVETHKDVPLNKHLRFRLREAGHMLGSACVYLESDEDGQRVRLGFSGDVGRDGLPIIRDPERLPPVDYLILESTYGNRIHQPLELAAEKLADAISRTAARGGKIIAPAFAVGRTQQLVLMVHDLVLAKRIPTIPVFVDSPLAVNVTEVFRKHEECYDAETREFLDSGSDPFGFRMLRYIRDVQESKALNDMRGPCLIISASGMCEAGRILHHLWNNIEDGRNTILITGFQAEHTLGRKIVEKMPEVNIFGEPRRLRAEVVRINELSGHADQQELLAWIKPLVGAGLKKVFLVHGEPAQQEVLAELIRETYGIEAEAPARGDSYTLE
jgi:metallo-beta-lactamase family protein